MCLNLISEIFRIKCNILSYLLYLKYQWLKQRKKGLYKSGQIIGQVFKVKNMILNLLTLLYIEIIYLNILNLPCVIKYEEHFLNYVLNSVL